jgi:hypothetical protein
MDLTPFFPPLVSVLTTALISAVKDPVGRIFENRTTRVQFWKTMLDTAPLADVTDVTFIKAQCRQEIADAVDAAAMASNKFVGEVSLSLLLGAVVFIFSFMARISTYIMSNMRQDGTPASIATEFSIVLAIAQAAILAIAWFWGRWMIRRWVWEKIKPGAFFDFLLEKGPRQKTAAAASIIGLLLTTWVCYYIAFSEWW